MTPLDKTLKRSVAIKGLDYVVTLTPDTLKLTRKGKRLGMELKWADITSGESALAVALRASVGRFDIEKERKPATTKSAPAINPAALKPSSSRRSAVARRPPKKRTS